MNKSMREHWNKVYSNTDETNLGWYEESPTQSINLLKKCKLNTDDKILIVGAGISTFVDYLIEQKYTNIIVTDISSVAIDIFKNKLGNKSSNNVNFIIDDLINPEELNKMSNISLWYDRAVLHFFTEEKDKLNYFSLLNKIVKLNGYVIIAVFSLIGAKCSGLDVVNYNQNILKDYLGNDFKLITHFDYQYINPSGGVRPYIYTLFQRIKKN